MEQIVRKNKFEGYHHNIVAYTLSWLFHLSNLQIDLENIWRKQSVSDSIIESLYEMSIIVNDHIRNTSQNITEYCKKEECWESLLEKDYHLPAIITEDYTSSREVQQYSSDLASETEAREFCKEKPSQSWFALAKWLKDLQFLTPKARSQCFNMGRALNSSKGPSVILGKACMKIWKDAEARGWSLSLAEEIEKTEINSVL